MALPLSKVSVFKRLCMEMLDKGIASLREPAHLLGKFSWAVAAVPNAQSHYRNLQRAYIVATSFNKSLSRTVTITSAMGSNLRWWGDNLINLINLIIVAEGTRYCNFSDASNTARGPWTDSERKLHINKKELLAAWNALKCFAVSQRRAMAEIFLDNSTAVSYINHGGGTISRGLNKLAIALLSWGEQRDLNITATFLP